ncbi:PCP reductase family protein [Rhodocaloribacter litoris]|uniref:PCP reductase family protein n=1 Tax=Rhodocaloribacter litoris TaxID=2558931 RepID=UPI001E29F9EB|nr:PCP reductase family protein [Rhodocaloribacter litoris]QXD15943.1 PCP reductase family protein [Rhodocaloribacter litoris]GIV60153.1 MAG: hypothetical protein KatS3mg043_1242 [Rhodothermaceae bacterium]
MKFLCVACDEAMTLKETRGPDDGSMTVVFACPACGHAVAMLTNAMETQVVRSLGVKIGGRTTPAAPMEMVRSSLTTRREGAFEDDRPASPATPPAAEAGSKCPFTGMVNAAYERTALPWTAEAEARLERIPAYVRPMVRKGIEQHARDHGYARIDAAVMDEVKGLFGL